MAEELRPADGQAPRAANDQGKITEEGVAAYTRLTWPPEAPPQPPPPHWTAVALSTLRSDRATWLGMLDQRMVDTMIAPLLPHDRRPWTAGPAPRPGPCSLEQRLADCDVVAMSAHDGNRLLVETVRALDQADKRCYVRGLELVRFDDAAAPTLYLGKPSGFHGALPYRDMHLEDTTIYDNNCVPWQAGWYGTPEEANLKIFRPGYNKRVDVFVAASGWTRLVDVTFDGEGMPFALMMTGNRGASIWCLDGNLATPAVWFVEANFAPGQHHVQLFVMGIIATSDAKLLVWGRNGFHVHCAVTGARLSRCLFTDMPALASTTLLARGINACELMADGSLALLTADHRLFRLANHLRGDC